MNQIAIPDEIRCDFSSSYHRHSTCRKPAVAALVDVQRPWVPDDPTNPDGAWHYGEPKNTYHGRCAQHAGAEKRKKYGKRPIVDFTPEVIAQMLAEIAEAKQRDAAEQARRNAEADERTERYRARRFEEAKIEYECRRQDEQGSYDFTASRKAGEEVRHPDIPTWVVVPKGSPEHERSLCSVQVHRTPGWPTTINQMGSNSDLNTSAAEALLTALQNAIAEVQS